MAAGERRSPRSAVAAAPIPLASGAPRDGALRTVASRNGALRSRRPALALRERLLGRHVSRALPSAALVCGSPIRARGWRIEQLLQPPEDGLEEPLQPFPVLIGRDGQSAYVGRAPSRSGPVRAQGSPDSTQSRVLTAHRARSRKDATPMDATASSSRRSHPARHPPVLACSLLTGPSYSSVCQWSPPDRGARRRPSQARHRMRALSTWGRARL